MTRWITLRSEKDRRLYLQTWLDDASTTPEEVLAAIADIDRSHRGLPTRHKKPDTHPGKC